MKKISMCFLRRMNKMYFKWHKYNHVTKNSQFFSKLILDKSIGI